MAPVSLVAGGGGWRSRRSPLARVSTQQIPVDEIIARHMKNGHGVALEGIEAVNGRDV